MLLFDVREGIYSCRVPSKFIFDLLRGGVSRVLPIIMINDTNIYSTFMRLRIRLKFIFARRRTPLYRLHLSWTNRFDQFGTPQVNQTPVVIIHFPRMVCLDV